MRKRSKSAAARRGAAVWAAISMMLTFPCAYGKGFDLPLLGISAGAESTGTCGESLVWELDDEGTLTISGTGEMYDWKTRESPFYNNRDIKTVIIEDGVTFIGGYAFQQCQNITAVSIPESVKGFGIFAFASCKSLSDIKLPDGLNTISQGLFYECSALERLDIPKSVTSIGRAAFYACFSIDGIVIPDGVTILPRCVFYCCSKLSAINIPYGVTSIDDCALAACRSLTSLEIPETVTYLGVQNFTGSGITEITIPKSVTKMGYDLFSSSKVTDIYYTGTEAQWKAIDYNNLMKANVKKKSINSYLQISDDVTIHFLGDTPEPDNDLTLGGGISVSSSTSYTCGTFELYVDIPASDNWADEISLNVEFDPEAFEVVSWYSNNTSSLDYIQNIISGAWVDHGSDYLSLTASNKIPLIDLSKGIHLTAKMKVKNTASVGNHSITLKKADICRYDAELDKYRHFWEPETEYLEVSVMNDVVSGHISGYGDNKGIITVTLFDPDGRAVSSMTAVDGDYVFSGLTPGASYSVRASMPRCAPRTVTFTAGDSVTEQNIVLRKYGDVNGDTFVDAKDATQIMRYEVGMPSLIKGADDTVDTYLLQVADIIGSGKPSSKDATQILRYDVGITSIFDRLV